MDRRRERRINNIGAIESYSFQGDNQVVEIDRPIEISLKDISVGGLGIKSDTAFEMDTTLSIDLIVQHDHFVVIGKIVWCRENGTYYDCGLKLIYMPDELVDVIEDISDEPTLYPN